MNRGFLSLDERRELLGVLHRSGHSAQEHGRANAILLLDEGVPLPLIAKLLFLDEQTVRNLFARYQVGKISVLLSDGRTGRKSELSDSQKEMLRSHVAEHLYTDSSLIAAYILLEFGIKYSPSGVKRLLHGLGFVYKKPKHIPGKADAAVQADFALRIQELMRRKSSDSKVYFMDATHPHYNSSPSSGWILKGTDKELPANSGRQRLNLNGAVDIESHQAIIVNSLSINAESTIELLRCIEAANPEAERIYVFCDNAAYYHSREVREYLSRSRISLEFLPPYSPNLNLIERLWKLLRKEVVNNRYYSSFKEFTEECLFFFERLPDYADRLDSLLSLNFQLFNNGCAQRVLTAY